MFNLNKTVSKFTQINHRRLRWFIDWIDYYEATKQRVNLPYRLCWKALILFTVLRQQILKNQTSNAQHL